MNSKIIPPLLILLTLFSLSVQGQSDNKADNQRILEEKNFIFIAQSVSPQRGMTRPLTSYYDMVVKPDTIVAFLPYFGRAYSAPIDPTDGGIKFTSTSYAYEMTSKKKKGYDIQIKPKDATGIVSLRFTAFDNGRATLQVTQSSKDPITFSGYFIAGPERAKKAF